METEYSGLMEIEPYTLVRDILKNWLFILLGALSAVLIVTIAVNMKYVPEYSTTATFVVGSKDSNNTYSNLSAANTMATTFQKVLESTIMKKTLCDELGVDEINADISTEVAEGTNLLSLTVKADTPKESIDIIRAIMENYSDVSIYAVGNASMTVLEEPTIPYQPENSLDERSVQKKGFVVGALLFIFLFGLESCMRNTVKQEDEIEKKLDARSLGAIGFEAKHKTLLGVLRRKKAAVLVDNPLASFSFVENYKRLASKVEYQMAKDDGKVLVVTSVSENEGKSTVAANLAISFAEQGKKVILIDGDIRRPSQFLIFGYKPVKKNELGEYLKSTSNAGASLIKDPQRKTLYFFGGCNCYSSSTEMLLSGRLEKLIQVCRKNVDYVIIDTPPAGLLGDAYIFAQNADASLLVAKQNYMLAEDINDVLDKLRGSDSRVLGVVLNEVRTFSGLAGSSTGGRYGYYGRYGNYNKKKG